MWKAGAPALGAGSCFLIRRGRSKLHQTKACARTVLCLASQRASSSVRYCTIRSVRRWKERPAELFDIQILRRHHPAALRPRANGR